MTLFRILSALMIPVLRLHPSPVVHKDSVFRKAFLPSSQCRFAGAYPDARPLLRLIPVQNRGLLSSALTLLRLKTQPPGLSHGIQGQPLFPIHRCRARRCNSVLRLVSVQNCCPLPKRSHAFEIESTTPGLSQGIKAQSLFPIRCCRARRCKSASSLGRASCWRWRRRTPSLCTMSNRSSPGLPYR